MSCSRGMPASSEWLHCPHKKRTFSLFHHASAFRAVCAAVLRAVCAAVLAHTATTARITIALFTMALLSSESGYLLSVQHTSTPAFPGASAGNCCQAAFLHDLTLSNRRWCSSTIRTKRRTTTKDVKISWKVSLFDARPACTAGVRISWPNFNRREDLDRTILVRQERPDLVCLKLLELVSFLSIQRATVFHDSPLMRAMLGLLTPSTLMTTISSKALRLHWRRWYGVPKGEQKVLLQVVPRYRRRLPRLSVTNPWRTMFPLPSRPCSGHLEFGQNR